MSDTKQRQQVLRALARQMASQMMGNAEQLTHRGKQQLLIEAADAERMKAIKSLMLRVKREGFASNDIKSGVRFNADGNPKVIGFLMPRHAFLSMLGVSSGHAMGSNRASLDFYTPVINANLPAMADIIGEFNADLLLNAFTMTSFFNKEVL